MRLDRLGEEALLADPLDEHLPRHLPGAEAGHLDPVGEVVRGVLDGVVHLARRHLDGQTNAILPELLELGLHRRAIESGTSGLALAG